MTDRYGHPRQTIFGRRHASAAASVSYSTSQHPSQAPQQQHGAPSQHPSHHHMHHPSASGPAHGPGAGPTVMSSAAAMGPPAAPAAVRRNLFQSQLTRRPPPGKSSGVGGGGVGVAGAGVGVGGLGVVGLDGADDDDTVVVDEEEQDVDEGDGGIVVRDVHGEVELDEPPFLAVEDPDEIVLDRRQENESKWSPSLAYLCVFIPSDGWVKWAVSCFLFMYVSHLRGG